MYDVPPPLSNAAIQAGRVVFYAGPQKTLKKGLAGRVWNDAPPARNQSEPPLNLCEYFPRLRPPASRATLLKSAPSCALRPRNN
jgi:hypothetical protein